MWFGIVIFEFGVNFLRFLIGCLKATCVISGNLIETLILLIEIHAVKFPDYFGRIELLPGGHVVFVHFSTKFDSKFSSLFLILIIPVFLTNLLDVVGNSILQ